MQPAPTSIPLLLESWLATSLVLKEDWDQLPDDQRSAILHSSNDKTLRRLLVTNHLLNEYQADRLASGSTFGLVLGNYRVLSRLGAGGMGVVFLAEHTRMRREVAIKVLSLH